MKSQRDRGAAPAQRGPGRTTEPIAPGRVTLTEQLTEGLPPLNLSRGGGPAGAAPVQPRVGASPGPRPASRDAAPVPARRDAESEPAEGSGARVDKPAPDWRRGGLADLGSGGVAATVVGAAADTEVAFDNSFTPALVAALEANPDLSIDDVLQHVSAASFGPGVVNADHLHHPTIVQYGQAVPSADGRETRKRAVLIGNQNYLHIPSLFRPIEEAGAMQSQLASRGYDADVHHDRTANDMGALWGSLVGAASHGDDLVAYYSGHGMREGLAGVEHDRPPNPPDVFSNAQVSGVVSAATGKGAHIRFVIDSCYAGAAVQTVREERHNALAAVAAAVGEPVRFIAMAGLREAKAELLALCERRRTTLDQLGKAIVEHQNKRPAAGGRGDPGEQGEQGDRRRDVVAARVDHRRPDPGSADGLTRWHRVLNALIAARARVEVNLDRAVERRWESCVPLLDIVKRVVHHPEAPPPITDLRTLGAQLNYLDDLWNTASQPIERAAKTEAKTEAAPVTG